MVVTSRYGALGTLGWIFVLMFVPETKARTLETMASLFKGRGEEKAARAEQEDE